MINISVYNSTQGPEILRVVNSITLNPIKIMPHDSVRICENVRGMIQFWFMKIVAYDGSIIGYEYFISKVQLQNMIKFNAVIQLYLLI